MTNRDDLYYRAMLARDHRFDGRFFVGVKTTGIYCRPICPARPKRENVEFFASAAAADKAGYRPCLRCRPESAPHSPAWIGRSAVVQRALRLISTQPDAHFDESEFASRFGLSARHLRRLFLEEVGRTPKRIRDSIRLDFARQLIVETRLPITEIAFTSGYRSLRRFNDAIRTRFRRTPSGIRTAHAAGGSRRGAASPGPGVRLTLAYRPPFDWRALLQFYRAHCIEGVEQVSATTYARAFAIEGGSGWVEVTHDAQRSRLEIRVLTADHGCLFHVAQRVRLMFDLDSDPVVVANAFSVSPLLCRLRRKHPGLRIARGWSPYETAVGTILGQLVSTTRARQLTGRLVREYGQPLVHPLTGETWYRFPTPACLAAAHLAEIGTTRVRREALRVFSRLVARGELSLAAEQDPGDFRDRLQRIPGIGPWSAEYIALRAMGDTDAFPGRDLILRRVTELHPDLDPEAVRPWRGYAAIHLWHAYATRLSGSARGPRRGVKTRGSPGRQPAPRSSSRAGAAQESPVAEEVRS
ncbi:MAG: AlkA N-terminal domain-containing protein [Candidatus Eisenbacteria bacterium]